MSFSKRPRKAQHLYNPSTKPLSQVFSHRDYYDYYKNLLVDKNMKLSTFKRMIEAESEQLPQFFRIKADGPYKEKLREELENFMPILKKSKMKALIYKCLEEKYGTMAQVFFSSFLVKQRPNLESFSDWVTTNTKAGFLSRFNFSSLIPFIFLDIQPSDSILSCGLNNPNSTEIICQILNDGHIFVNVEDIKKAKSDFGFGSPNYCVLSYPISEIPNIQEFDKVLCISPSIEDGSIRNTPGVNSIWSIDKAIKYHNDQKKYLISALEKVKVGGICVYSTHSINPFENEAVVNSVLKMKQYEGKFEIIDCSNMFKEIKRKKGLTSWDLNGVSQDNLSDELKSSLSCDSLIDGIDRCMRFYPHQINSNGTFIVAIKKLDDIEKQYTLPLPEVTENSDSKSDAGSKWVSDLTKVPHSVIKKIISDFGLPNECKKIPFIYSQTPKINILFNVTKGLKEMLNENVLKVLRICHLGARAFSFSSNYPEEPSIPSVQFLPEIAKQPTERVITISMDNFKAMIESCQISVDQLSKENQAYLKSISTGGIYIMLEGYGPLLGGLWKDPMVRLIVKKGAATQLYKTVEVFLSKDEENPTGEEEEEAKDEENNGAEEEEAAETVGEGENAPENNDVEVAETAEAVPDATEEGEQQQTHKRRRRRKSHKDDE